VSEVIAEHGLNCRLVRAGVDKHPGGATGSVDWMLRAEGLSSSGIAERALRAFRETRAHP
jgi:hypothetical protein